MRFWDEKGNRVHDVYLGYKLVTVDAERRPDPPPTG